MKAPPGRRAIVALFLLAACDGPEHAPPEVPPPIPPANPEAAEASDVVVTPGGTAGLIRPDTSRADLAELFGEEALEDRLSEHATRVHLGPDHSLTVEWADRRRERAARVRELGPAWRTPEGVRTGLTLHELEAAIGPFRCVWQRPEKVGTVVLEGTRLEPYDGLLDLRVAPRGRSTLPRDCGSSESRALGLHVVGMTAQLGS